MKYLIYTAALLAATASPAFAEVKSTSESGFNIIHVATVEAAPDEIWKRLLAPKDYWNKAHSWSGSTAGFYIDAQANGCFCELFQEPDANGKLKTVGSVEHMRVIFAQPGKVLRMQGALGPLQSEAVIGTLTVAMDPNKNGVGTTVSFSYVVGGYMRYKVSEIAPAVDRVLGEQFTSMLSPFPSLGAGVPKVDSAPPELEEKDETSTSETAQVDGAPDPETNEAEEPPSEPQ